MARRAAAAWLEGGLRFGCTSCGRCCTLGALGGRVSVAPREAAALARASGEASAEAFLERYARPAEGGARQVLRTAPHPARGGAHACVLLGPDGRTCSAHAARPAACAAYPFLPEAVRSAYDWEAERAVCEGIDNEEVGVVVPRDDVRLAAVACEAAAAGEDATYDELVDLLGAVDEATVREFEEGMLGSVERVARARYAGPSRAVVVDTVPVPDADGRGEPDDEHAPHGTRALVFAASPHYEQTVVALDADGGPAPERALQVPVHRALAASVAAASAPLDRVCVLGAGGGALPLALRAALPEAHVDAVELDEDVVSASRAWFGVAAAEGDRLTVHVGDAADFLARALPGEYGAVVLDVAGSGAAGEGGGLVAPVSPFDGDAFLGGTARRALAPGGVLLCNAAGDRDALLALATRLKRHFKSLHAVELPSNLVLVASDAPPVSAADLFQRLAAKPGLWRLCAGVLDNTRWLSAKG